MFTEPLASLLSFFYNLIPSYGVAIILLTIAVMIAVLPLTLKATRSMLAMQRLSPEIKKLQDKHKNDRQKLNEEMMQLYRDNNIKPLGACLPMLLQLPIFIILYNVINGLSHENSSGQPEPKYLEHHTQMYKDLVADSGKMQSFGIDLASSATAAHATFWAALPFYLLLILMVGLQYIQQWQVSSKSPPSDNPMAQQMKMVQKVFPPLFGVISLGFPAGVVLYWVSSSIFRITQQWAMYRYDPLLKTTVESAKKEAERFLSEDDSGRAQKKGQQSGSKNKKKRKR